VATDGNCGCGNSGVVAFSVASNGSLSPVPGSPFLTGGGNIAIAVDPKGKYLYTSGFVSNTNTNGVINAFKINQTTGALTALAGSPYPIIPVSCPGCLQGEQCNDLTTDRNGNFLIGPGWNNGVIYVYRINRSTGALAEVAGSPFVDEEPQQCRYCVGAAPNSVTVQGNNGFVFVQNQGQADNLVAYQLDAVTGALTMDSKTWGPLDWANTGEIRADSSGSFVYALGQLIEPGTPFLMTGYMINQANGSGNHYASLSLSLVKHLGRRGELGASYAYGESWDRMDPPGGLGISLSGLGVAADQIGSTALDGTLEHRRLARSVYDVPHKVRVSGTVELPLHAMLSLIYEGSSGSPFTYVVDGDINADGFGPELFGQESNDVIYVPTDAAPGGDIALLAADGQSASVTEYATLERFIESEPCLATQRGRIMRRNTCRNAWQSQLDVRLGEGIVTGGDRELQLTLDVFNLPHLLDQDWGLVRRTADFGLEEVPLARLVGFDAARQRGIYQLRLPDRRHIDLDDAFAQMMAKVTARDAGRWTRKAR